MRLTPSLLVLARETVDCCLPMADEEDCDCCRLIPEVQTRKEYNKYVAAGSC